MFNDGFSSYGYDQVIVNPAANNYADYNKSLLQPSSPDISYSIKSDNSKHEQPRQLIRPIYEDVYDYLEKSVQRATKKINKEDDVEELKKKIADMQYKYDILMVFIICLIVYVLVTFNSHTKHQPYVYYNAQASMPISTGPVPMPSAPAAVLSPAGSVTTLVNSPV